VQIGSSGGPREDRHYNWEFICCSSLYVQFFILAIDPRELPLIIRQ